MQTDIYDIMLNPTRMRIVQTLASQNTITANEICRLINDVPRTTLYRHINLLIEADILSVVEEKKVRGSVERTLALNLGALSGQNTEESIPQQAFKFLMNIYAKFETHFKDTTRIHETNKVFFNNTVMMMNDTEFDEFLSELQVLFVKHHYDAADGRKPRNISIISAPPERDEDE